MRSAFLFSLALVLGTSSSWAALSSDAGSAVSFYRSRLSPFPSGQASRTALENSLQRSENELSFRARWNHKEYGLESNQVLRSIQVARFVDAKMATAILNSANTGALRLKEIPANTTLEITETDDMWAKVKLGALTGWIPLHHLKNRHDDTGVFLNLVETALRPKPEATTQALLTIPRLQRIVPLEITKSFLKIQYQGQIGYADITQFVSRADFASLAYHPKKNWFTVIYRNNDMMIGQKGEVIPLKEIQGFVTPMNKGIVISSRDFNGPQIRSRVEIIKPEAYAWGVSKVDGHGEVFWKRKNLLLEEKPSSPNTLTTDELLKREIYSVAFESKSSVRGVVSSEGVYRTDDGLTWTQVPLFGKQNLPVSIHPNGAWFVGAYKSLDKGKTFDPFIRWDKLALAIEQAYHRNPKILRLTQIEALPNSQVQISVDTGGNKVKLKSLIGDIRWSVVR
ncbi:hypothetical protein AZI86_14750 [Bdellovibrio bacteriovorus]|uniref:SH3b domain-containing protein n=1 Tax=Bdellovibrio bacteriovorus TaxID=959 RepID=A0A150WK39_BDEBC|nr:hypothetical protein [Bdellovibrio bacteriovorus]KYG64060.1 hypothetical protein AZI86_14750 [Bdellovibrio bacteriovorus]